MEQLHYTLLADGTSDECLIPVINWTIGECAPDLRVISTFARVVRSRTNRLADRIDAALRDYPCDLLIVHRDAEAVPLATRQEEILREAETDVPIVSLVPVRMTEAWLFSDEAAIRFASENASGRHAIDLPHRHTWETLRELKEYLLRLIARASGKNQRALARFNVERARTMITLRSTDFAPLRGLSSFDEFERHLILALERLHALD